MSSSPIPVIPPVAQTISDLPQTGLGSWLVSMAHALNLVLGGKVNATATVTLTASATSTILTDSRIGVYSYVGLQPTTASAAAAVSGGLYIANGQGSATINHPSNAAGDQTFTVLIIG